MKHVRRACTFMQVVDVLCDDRYFKIFFKAGENFVAAIGCNLQRLLSSLIVKVEDERPIFIPAFGRSNVFNAITFPQTTGIAECRDTAFGADACATQDDYV